MTHSAQTKKSIDTLVSDVYDLLEGEIDLDKESVTEFGQNMTNMLVSRLSDKDKIRSTMSMSNYGTKCERKLWYTVNTPEDAEPLHPNVRLKFLIGDIIEELVLFLAKAAGHRVEGEQDTLEYEGVKGHRDAVIDGVQVDVKSANSRSFDKFKHHKLGEDDPFGYLDQQSLYLEAAQEDESVEEKDNFAFLAVDKELGHLKLDAYPKKDIDYKSDIEFKRAMLKSKEPPKRAYEPVPDGKSGNTKLPVPCVYCQFRKKCWPQVRTFLYSNGPRHLVDVARTPDVPEVE